MQAHFTFSEEGIFILDTLGEEGVLVFDTLGDEGVLVFDMLAGDKFSRLVARQAYAEKHRFPPSVGFTS